MTSNPLDPHTLDRLVSWLEPWGENTPHKEAAEAIKALRARVSQLEHTAHYQTLKLTLDTSVLKLPTTEQLVAQLQTDRMTHSVPMFGPYGYLCGHVCLDEEHHSYEQDPITPADEYWSIPLFSMAPPPAPGRYPAPTANMAAALADIADWRRSQIYVEMDETGDLVEAAAFLLQGLVDYRASGTLTEYPRTDIVIAAAHLVAALERLAEAGNK